MMGMRRHLLFSSVVVIAAGCSRTIDVSVALVDPCNQNAVASVDFLKLEPRGEGIDSTGLTTVVNVSMGSAPAIKIPLANDFQLIATGHKMSFDAPPSAIGVSAKKDLSNAKSRVSIRVPFALVDAFYKTTSLDEPQNCSTLAVSRVGATATYLPDSSKVLIVGGASIQDDMLTYTRLVELYDPATGTFSAATELRTGGARAYHTATLLSDGRVLIAGGEGLVMGAKETLKSALIIDAHDPMNVQVSDGIAMREAREGHIAARLADGRVVIAGGRALNPGMPNQHLKSVEIFDPDKGSFSLPVDGSGNTVSLSVARYAHSGTALQSGHDVLIAGGMNDSGPVLNPEVLRMGMDGTMSIVTSDATLGVGPIAHAADIASNGAVLLSGGYATVSDGLPESGLPMHPSANVEMWQFKETTGTIEKLCGSALSMGRGYHTVSMIGRRAAFIGGRGADGMALANGEVAELLGAGSSCFAQPPSLNAMTDARTGHAMAKLPSGEILVAGGLQQTAMSAFGRTIDSAEVYSPAREP
jgi:hypothetical protein